MKSMLDEKTDPQAPRYSVCPCCLVAYRSKEDFIAHLKSMKLKVDKALTEATK